MEMDITHISTGAPVREIPRRQVPAGREAAVQAKKVARAVAETSAEKLKDRVAVERYLREIINYTEFFNKRLRFSINEELDQVVVKVIDSKTDKVIKEIPPEVLQRLHIRIREAIGLLIDEMI